MASLVAKVAGAPFKLRFGCEDRENRRMGADKGALVALNAVFGISIPGR